MWSLVGSLRDQLAVPKEKEEPLAVEIQRWQDGHALKN